jgi:hypothetical protein
MGGGIMAEIGRMKKNETTEIVVQKTEYRGSVGIDVREYVTSERYTGWSKNGVRIPVEMWPDFKAILEKVDLGEMAKEANEISLPTG